MVRRVFSGPRLCGLVVALGGLILPTNAAEFTALEPLLQEHCVECHSAQEPEGGLNLESAAELMKGGESGPAILVGKGAESLLIKALEGNWGKTGKNQFMPPGKRAKLKPEQIALFKAWIDAGAPLPTNVATARELTVPRVEPRGTPRRPVQDLAYHAGRGWLAVVRPDEIEVLSGSTRQRVQRWTGFRGSATAVAFSPDGQWLYAGVGDATGGEVWSWKMADGAAGPRWKAHRDVLHALAVSPDGTTVASGGYDYGIHLWSAAEGKLRASILGNQGAIVGLAYRPAGDVLGSVGFDRTAKLYRPSTGERLETLSHALKELNALAFSPDGRRLVTGSNDNRIRVYRLATPVTEGSTELVDTVFAHEGAILKLAFSPDGRTLASAADDRTVKLFEGETLKPRLTLESQPDWPTALAFVGDTTLAVGRADGSLAFYQASNGAVAAPPKPELFRTSPRGLERGTTGRVRLEGKNLETASVVRVYRQGRLHSAEALQAEKGDWWVTLMPAADEPLGAWELSVGDGASESARVKVWVDDLPQVDLSAEGSTSAALVSLPRSVWSTLKEPGQSLEFSVKGQAGQHLVFDVSAQRLGTKGDYQLTLLDPAGRVLAQNDNWRGQADPWLEARLTESGTYRVRVNEVTFAGSPDHAFRLSVGELPFVTGFFPLVVPAGATSQVEVLGANLGSHATVQVVAGAPGDLALPEPVGSWRSRREQRLSVTPLPTVVEREPNSSPGEAQILAVPGVMNGRLEAGDSPDADFIRFAARAGVTYVLETVAAQRGSPADTRLEVFWPDGRPVERVRLQALRNSAITFRPETSDDSGIRFENWEEMQLNDLLWCGGEVMKLFRAPQGPDSDSVLYSVNGLRQGFFDTTPVAHYVEEPVYFVRPLAPGEKPVPNGLPVFTLNQENDDAALRDLGTDSRLFFVAPAAGEFVVRVTDSREFGGRSFGYGLVVREAKPDFAVTLNGANPTVAAGSGQSLSLTARRLDGFEGPIQVTIQNLPEGWSVPGPIVIEAGHSSASVPLRAAPEAKPAAEAAWDAVSVVATAEIEGRPVALAVNSLGRPKLVTEPPKLKVTLLPLAPSALSPGLPVVTISPGGTARARLQIVRNGFDGVVTFSVDNLPHGVIVENLGLNGITFLAGENEREISFSAVPWVTEQDRPFFAVENQAGRQTSGPVLLQVRRERPQAAAP